MREKSLIILAHLNLQVRHTLQETPNTHTLTQNECEERNTHLSNSATDIGFFSTGLHFQFHPHSSSMLPFPFSSVKNCTKSYLLFQKWKQIPCHSLEKLKKYICFTKVVLLKPDNKHSNTDFCCRSGKNKRG